MGATNTGPTDEQKQSTGGTTNTSTNSKNTGAGSGGTTRTGGTTAGTGATEKQGQNLPRLVTVDVPGETKPEEPKKKRGRPPGSTTKRPSTTKKTAAATQKADSGHIKILLLTVSGIMASREGMQIWALTPQEVDSLADPLAAVLEKHNVGEATSEYAEYIALVMALFVVFVPKYLMWKEINKQRKAEKQNEPQRINTQQQQPTPNENRTPATNSGQSSPTAANDGPSFSGKLSSFIPAIV